MLEPGFSSLNAGRVTLAFDCMPGGDQGRSPIVLLHGGGQTRHSWSRTAERLQATGRSVLTLDSRGHGNSSWDPQGDYTLDAFVGDLVVLLRHLGRPAILVGASLGGVTSLTIAGEHPELVAGLVMVDVVIDAEPEGVQRIHDFMTANPDGFATLAEVADAIAAYNPHRKRPTNLDGLRKNVRQGADGRWRWHWDPAMVRIDDEPTRKIDPDRLRRAAAKVSAPTLIVRGGHSDVVGDAGLADMIDRVPHAEVANVGAAGHMVAGDDNDVFGVALEAFLRDLP
jgi:pimeloyl-ACP methyl ester carboxylesterase